MALPITNIKFSDVVGAIGDTPPYNLSDLCTDPDVDPDGLDATYCPGGELQLVSASYDLGDFRNYDPEEELDLVTVQLPVLLYPEFTNIQWTYSSTTTNSNCPSMYSLAEPVSGESTSNGNVGDDHWMVTAFRRNYTYSSGTGYVWDSVTFEKTVLTIDTSSLPSPSISTIYSAKLIFKSKSTTNFGRTNSFGVYYPNNPAKIGLTDCTMSSYTSGYSFSAGDLGFNNLISNVVSVPLDSDGDTYTLTIDSSYYSYIDTTGNTVFTITDQLEIDESCFFTTISDTPANPLYRLSAYDVSSGNEPYLEVKYTLDV